MPHIHLITTSDVPENQDIVDILERLVHRLSQLETVTPKAIKAHHSLRNTWVMGGSEGDRYEGFVHCELVILSGRSQEMKEAFANVMFQELKECFSISVAGSEISVTLDVREMQAPTYRK